jgi:PEP-CTERM/exosortase A-associated glycosyltransferase
MKVLHVLDHSIPLHSGYTFRTRAILEQQKELGIQTAHLTSAKQGPYEHSPEIIDDLTFYRTKVPKGWLLELPIVNQFIIIHSLKQSLLEVIKLEEPDLIHAHSPALNGVAAYWAAKQCGLPLVYEIRAFWEDAAVDHGTCKEGDWRYRLTRALENYVVKKADAVTVICQGLKDDLLKRGVLGQKITLIPNAVSIEKFSERKLDEKAKARLKLSLNLQQNFVLGFIGSFYAYEGLDQLLYALQKIQSMNSNSGFKLLLVGGGPEEDKLKALAKTLGISKDVLFVGRVPHEQVANYYDLVDLLVFPRKSMRLTDLVTPLKPLEAMAQQKLVLASDVGGHKELITDNVNGYLFQADDIQQLVERIQFICHTQHQALLDNALEFVQQERNWAKSVSHYLPLYAALLEQ